MKKRGKFVVRDLKEQNKASPFFGNRKKKNSNNNQITDQGDLF